MSVWSKFVEFMDLIGISCGPMNAFVSIAFILIIQGLLTGNQILESILGSTLKPMNRCVLQLWLGN
ncbi:MAG TPA: hypothetical protein DD412_01175 [Holosporales bacterium]|nr:hypothetical protein [Holosporales bacterium]